MRSGNRLRLSEPPSLIRSSGQNSRHIHPRPLAHHTCSRRLLYRVSALHNLQSSGRQVLRSRSESCEFRAEVRCNRRFLPRPLSFAKPQLRRNQMNLFLNVLAISGSAMYAGVTNNGRFIGRAILVVLVPALVGLAGSLCLSWGGAIYSDALAVVSCMYWGGADSDHSLVRPD
jgi:hypothetical protein